MGDGNECLGCLPSLHLQMFTHVEPVPAWMWLDFGGCLSGPSRGRLKLGDLLKFPREARGGLCD